MSKVRGPNSALTEFLRSQGINANEIRRRHEKRERQAEELNNDDSPTEILASGDPGSGDDEDDEIKQIADDAAKKREFGNSNDLDGTAICFSCHSRFTITVYSKPVPDKENEFLCRVCSHSTRKPKPSNKPESKKRKKLAAQLLDLKFITPPSLQDLCITKAAERIESLDKLGNLSAASLNKISRILSKNRRLSSKTMQLFLQPHVTELEFWDCSEITLETFNLIPTLCPNLTSLVLGMCGQLAGDNLVRLAKMPKLESIHLDGPFMVRKDAWMDFFDTAGIKLKQLSISSVYRVDAEVLALMATQCTNLTHLSLKTLCQMEDPSPFYLIGTSLTNLTHLEISDLEEGAWSDDAIVQLLNNVGSQLDSLVIRNPKDLLSDRIINAIGECCGSLKRLELVNFSEVSGDAVAQMFRKWTEMKSNLGLEYLNLERCINVSDEAINAAIEHSGDRLLELNVNSLKLLKPSTIELFAKLPNLQKLDIGFVGQVNPRQIYKLSTSKSLRQVLAFGNIRISGMPLPTGMVLLGTM